MNKVTFDENACKGCELCTTVCPKKIVVMAKDRLNSRGFHPAQVIEQDKCIGCKFCATICPDVVITIKKEN